MSLELLLARRLELAKQIWPDATPISALSHLVEEAHELQEQPSLEEAADVFLMVLSWLELTEQSFDQLVQAAREKMEINRQRTWAPRQGLLHTKHSE